MDRARLQRLERHRDPERETPRPQPPAEHLLQLQRTAGNAAVARAILARQADPAAGRDAFAAQLWTRMGWTPSTGRGKFDIVYDPAAGRLTIVVKCKFWFEDGDPALWEGEEDAGPDSHLWGPAEILQWKADFKRKVSNAWSGKHTFHCTRDAWEDLKATVRVRFIESEEEADAHYVLNVLKLPELGDRRTSSVRRPSRKKKDHDAPGRTTLDSQDLEQYDGQTPAYHEAGHMLGLGDEYPSKKNKKRIAHAKLVRAEFHKGVLRARDDRIMSGGNRIDPEHGVTFLEALRAVTGMKEWGFTPKIAAAGLAEPAPEEPEAAFA